ncbi:MAG: hypothetical protein M3512_03175 [Bacteroidota bacterium]|nr:hypothetical protein [Bacteroidota bacterium]
MIPCICYNYDLYAKIYAKLNDHDGAYSYLNKANALKEVLFNEKLARSLSDIQMAEEEKNIKELEIAQSMIHEHNQQLCNINDQLDELVKAKTAELGITNKKLKEAIKEYATFIYKTSHDIRGPLARLMGICNIALVEIKHKNAIHYFEMLNTNAKHLNNTLTRLLTVIDIKNNEIENGI